MIGNRNSTSSLCARTPRAGIAAIRVHIDLQAVLHIHSISPSMLVLHCAPPLRVRRHQTTCTSTPAKPHKQATQVRVPKQSFVSLPLHQVRQLCGDIVGQPAHPEIHLLDALARLELVLKYVQKLNCYQTTSMTHTARNKPSWPSKPTPPSLPSHSSSPPP